MRVEGVDYDKRRADLAVARHHRRRQADHAVQRRGREFAFLRTGSAASRVRGHAQALRRLVPARARRRLQRGPADGARAPHQFLRNDTNTPDVPSGYPFPMFQLKRTPFHERTSKLCLPQNWRRWAGYIVAGSYDLHARSRVLGDPRRGGADRRLAADEVHDRRPRRRAPAAQAHAARHLQDGGRPGLLHRLVRRRRQAARRRHDLAPRRKHASA